MKITNFTPFIGLFLISYVTVFSVGSLKNESFIAYITKIFRFTMFFVIQVNLLRGIVNCSGAARFVVYLGLISVITNNFSLFQLQKKRKVCHIWFLSTLCYWEESICKQIEISYLLIVLLWIPLNKWPWCLLSIWIFNLCKALAL